MKKFIVSLSFIIIFALSACSSSNNSDSGEIVISDAVAPSNDLVLPFGNVTIGEIVDFNITVSNNGSGNLLIGTVGNNDSLASPFSFNGDTCSGQTLTAAASCTLVIRFSPNSESDFNDSFDIPSDDPDQASLTISVSGTGSPVPVPNIVITDSVAPDSDHLISFGNVVEGGSLDQSITIANNGSANLVMGNLASGDPIAPPFSLLNDTCSGQTVAPAQDCTVDVRFSPAAANTFNDTFNIPSNDPDTPDVSFTLEGNGTAAPAPSISVTESSGDKNDLNLTFAQLIIGNGSAYTVTISNLGTANLVLGTIGGTNPLAEPLSIASDNCSRQTLVPAGSCTFQVQYAPKTPGVTNDAFDIPSNDPNSRSLLMSVSASAIAKFIYVSASQTGQGDGTANNPYASIQTAIDSAVSGQTVSVDGGRYLENIVMKSSVDVIGAGANQSIIAGAATTSGIVLFPGTIDGGKIKGFTITTSAPQPGVDRGIVVQGTSVEAVIERNVITGVQYGIWLGSSPVHVLNNTLVDDGTDEQGIIILTATSQAVIENNIIINYNWGIHQQGTVTQEPTLLYNDVFNSSTLNYWGITDPTGNNGNISADPVLDSAYQPHPASPVIDTGNPTSPNDPNGTRANIGVF